MQNITRNSQEKGFDIRISEFMENTSINLRTQMKMDFTSYVVNLTRALNVIVGASCLLPKVWIICEEDETISKTESITLGFFPNYAHEKKNCHYTLIFSFDTTAKFDENLVDIPKHEWVKDFHGPWYQAYLYLYRLLNDGWPQEPMPCQLAPFENDQRGQ